MRIRSVELFLDSAWRPGIKLLPFVRQQNRDAISGSRQLNLSHVAWASRQAIFVAFTSSFAIDLINTLNKRSPSDRRWWKINFIAGILSASDYLFSSCFYFLFKTSHNDIDLSKSAIVRYSRGVGVVLMEIFINCSFLFLVAYCLFNYIVKNRFIFFFQCFIRGESSMNYSLLTECSCQLKITWVGLLLFPVHRY